MMAQIKLVRQKDTSGCLAAVFAMLTGLTYDEAVDILTDGNLDLVRENGLAKLEVEYHLIERGFAIACKYRQLRRGSKKREPWPPLPFARAHWCEVICDATSPGTHAVVMLEDGSVLDPEHDERRSLAEYHKVNFVAAVVPY